MIDDRVWRFGQWHRSTQALAELQQHQEAELRRGSFGHHRKRFSMFAFALHPVQRQAGAE
jgi:hypothetical protein